MKESTEKKSTAVLYGEVVARCWADEAYKKHFVEDPESVLEEAGIQLEEGIAYKVIEIPKLVQCVVLPAEGVMDAVQKLGKLLLAKADQTDKILPPGTELRIIQNTEDTHYLVLPVSPKSLSKEDFKAIAGGAGTGAGFIGEVHPQDQVFFADGVADTGAGFIGGLYSMWFFP